MRLPATRSFALAATILSSVTANAVSLRPRATVCNGHAELCDRSYGSVAYVGAHDSYAVGVDNLFANQDHDVTQQLNDGVRMLQLQVHNNGGALQLCHTSCIAYNGGTLQDYLGTVKKWLDANPNDGACYALCFRRDTIPLTCSHTVVSILMVNIDNQPASSFDTVYKAAGVDIISFSPESPTLPASGWPTLGSMIDSNRRLVSFLDNAADPSIPYLIDEFTNIWETAFNLIDPNLFDCSVNRTKGDTSTQMILINHFLNKLVLGNPAPDVDKANVTNAADGFGSLGTHAQTCTTVQGRPPNFMLVDFYEFGGGSVFQVAADINRVTYNPATPVAQPVTSTSAPSGSSTSRQNGATPLTAFDFSPLAAIATVVAATLLGAISVF